MSKSDYHYQIRDYAGRNIIIIEGLNFGRMSVTNNIENVVEEIGKIEKITPTEFMIVYRDSEGIWDGWDHLNNQFIPLSYDIWENAVHAYIIKQIKQIK